MAYKDMKVIRRALRHQEFNLRNGKENVKNVESTFETIRDIKMKLHYLLEERITSTTVDDEALAVVNIEII